jgi:hypothetical protein
VIKAIKGSGLLVIWDLSSKNNSDCLSLDARVCPASEPGGLDRELARLRNPELA